MRRRWVWVLLAMPWFFSCERAKEAVVGAKERLTQRVLTAVGGGVVTVPDPEWLKQVDQTSEGVAFRKDLPFPTRVDVVRTLNERGTLRITRNSVEGNVSHTLRGTQTTVTRLERNLDEVQFILLGSEWAADSEGGASDSAKEERQGAKDLSGGLGPVSHRFQKRSGRWGVAKDGQIKSAIAAREMEPRIEDILIDGGVATRRMWFGKHRFKKGDVIVLAESELPMVTGNGAKGSVTMEFEAISAVAGHPCGMFTVRGDYVERKAVTADGRVRDREVTIESGRIWLSLIYPVVLRREMTTIQTTRESDELVQGRIELSDRYDWKPGASP